MTPYDCAETIEMRNIFPKKYQQINSKNKQYKRNIVRNEVIKNGRSDHVYKLI